MSSNCLFIPEGLQPHILNPSWVPCVTGWHHIEACLPSVEPRETIRQLVSFIVTQQQLCRRLEAGFGCKHACMILHTPCLQQMHCPPAVQSTASTATPSDNRTGTCSRCCSDLLKQHERQLLCTGLHLMLRQMQHT